ESFAFVPIITKDWQKSRWCFGEWVAACVLGEIILPFVEASIELRSELSKFQHIRFRKEQPEFGKLVEDIDRIFSNTVKKDFNKCPFPYAFHYERGDADLFRGRDKEVDKIVSQLNAMRHSYDNRALILHGSSGAGKSSLVRAGLYPKLVRTSNFWIVAQL